MKLVAFRVEIDETEDAWEETRSINVTMWHDGQKFLFQEEGHIDKICSSDVIIGVMESVKDYVIGKLGITPEAFDQALESAFNPDKGEPYFEYDSFDELFFIALEDGSVIFRQELPHIAMWRDECLRMIEDEKAVIQARYQKEMQRLQDKTDQAVNAGNDVIGHIMWMLNNNIHDALNMAVDYALMTGCELPAEIVSRMDDEWRERYDAIISRRKGGGS